MYILGLCIPREYSWARGGRARAFHVRMHGRRGDLLSRDWAGEKRAGGCLAARDGEPQAGRGGCAVGCSWSSRRLLAVDSP